MTNAFDRIAAGNGQPPPHESTFPLPIGDESPTASEGTPKEVKDVTQGLLRSGYVEESGDPTMFRSLMVREQEVQAALEPLDLAVRLDTHRGIAFLVITEAAYDAADGGAWKHPLVRRQRLTLEQSLLVAMLRQAFVMHEQEAGVGQSPAKLTVDELLPQFLTYFEDSGSDNRNESRLLSLLDQLKTHGIVSEVDSKQEITICPLIAHLANPESLAGLLRVFRQRASANDAPQQESDNA